jgi:thiol:disulfide interchange protein
MNVNSSGNQPVQTAGPNSKWITTHHTRAHRRVPWGTMLVLVAIAYLQWPMLKGFFYRVSGVEAPASSIAWREDFEAATAEAKASDKPMLLVFSASWCPPCNAMRHDVWPDTAVSQVVNSDFVPRNVDVDSPASASVARRYGISGIPAVLVVDANGNVVRRESYMSRSMALDFLRADGA